METSGTAVTLVQFLIPAMCSGMLFAGTFLFLYMSSQYRSRLYMAAALFGALGFIFVVSETLIIGFGGMMRNLNLGLQFHRLEHLAGLFFIFAFPYLLSELLELTPGWRQFNRTLAFIGLGIGVVITGAAFIYPDSFISFTQHKPTWLTKAVDYGRGQEGFLYQARDGILGILMLYSFICIIVDLIKHKKFKFLAFPLTGLIIAIYGAVIDIIYVYQGVNYDAFPHEEFSRFSLGITMMILFSMAGLARRFVDSSLELEQAHKIITISEEKYRVLVEGTNDCIFTMDENLKILASNKATQKTLHIMADRLNGMSFYELLYTGPEDKKLSKEIIREEMTNFLTNKKPIELKVLLKSFATGEPRDLVLRLEYIAIDDRQEIVAKASGVLEDTLLQNFHSERQQFVIGNYLTTAEEMSARLVRNLPKYMASQEVNFIRLALREMIVNAIEHGNLNINFDEKTEATMNGNYLEFIMERRQNPQYKDKKITIEYSITPDMAAYKIADEGMGFDYKNIIQKIETEANENMLAHGRGLSLAFQIFDEVKYNGRGNQVLLVKKFNQQS